MSNEAAPGLSRRGLLRAGAGFGAATVAAGMLVDALATPAVAAPQQQNPVAENTEPVVAHVKDARTGEIDLFVGTRHIRVVDQQLAARLSNAAR